jgi:2-amino-4-hydroxy-6-hydroxymethyldihydropteridine diphosphokinase
MKPVTAHIALGANLGDRVANLREAVLRINHLPGTRVIARSSIYETPPWGKTDQPQFLNAVITVETEREPEALLNDCLAIEQEMGRIRRERWGPRAIDIDLLTHGNTRMRSARLTLPHPALAERAFVLVPLLEIAPAFSLDGESGRDLLARLDQTGIIPVATL